MARPVFVNAAEFFKLPETNLPMELINGVVVAPPVPRYTHQRTLANCAMLIKQIAPEGETCIGPNDVYLDEWNVLQPDVFWIRKTGNRCTLGEEGHWHGPPDLVVEILSDDIRQRFDVVDKFRIYAKHGVSEYWVVYPLQPWAQVWALDGGRYTHHGIFGPEESFTSPVLGGKTVSLGEVFAQGAED